MKLKEIILICVFQFCVFQHLSAQIYITGGYSNATTKDHNLYQNKENRHLFHFGMDTYIPLNAQKTLLSTGHFQYSPRGFYYVFDNTRYLVDFRQISSLGGIAFRPNKFFSIEGGLSLGILLKAYISNDTEKYKVTENYRRVDLGVYAGINIIHIGPVTPYFRYVHGLTNNLSYERFDNLGNVVGEIKDIKHRLFQLGIKVKILEIF